jgi:hypothetical protein
MNKRMMPARAGFLTAGASNPLTLQKQSPLWIGWLEHIEWFEKSYLRI